NWDPVTKIREGVIQALKDMGDASNMWKGTLTEIEWIWDKIAKAVGFVADKAAAFFGTREQWANLGPGGLPNAPPPSAVSTGGGPMTWENLGGQPGGLVGAAGGQPANGRVDVVIENKNAPPGQRVTATPSGPGVRTQVDTGTSMPWSAPEYGGAPSAPGGAAQW